MAKVNFLLWESIERNQFITAFYGILDASNRTLHYSNAGHNPPLLIDAQGAARFIEWGEQPLGMFRDTRYHEHYHTFRPGEIMVLYTDGVTEALNPNGEEFGRDRLIAAVRSGSMLSARELIASMQRDVLQWTDGVGLTDDATFFIIKAVK
jgi:sigma-B regulation protein RsbU (phosphoserine phosphatase)